MTALGSKVHFVLGIADCGEKTAVRSVSSLRNGQRTEGVLAPQKAVLLAILWRD